jgi:hypothetical protein
MGESVAMNCAPCGVACASKFLNYAPASSGRLLLRGPLADGHIGRQWKLCIDLQDHARKRSSY